MDYKTIIVGIGAMGRNHANKIMSDDLETMDLSVVCDCDVDRLKKFQDENPDIPVA